MGIDEELRTTQRVNQAIEKTGEIAKKSAEAITGTIADRAQFGKNNTYGRTDGEDVQTGSYNTIKDPELNQMADMGRDMTKNPFRPTDAAQGFHKVKEAVFGKSAVNEITRKEYANTFYNRSAEDMFNLGSLFGESYHMGKVRSMSITNDYYSNISTVEKFLEEKGINAKNLNMWEINRSLKTGQMSHFYHHGQTIKLDAETAIALKELRFLKSQKNDILASSRRVNLKEGISGFTRKTFKESDAYKGLSTAKTSKRVIKASYGMTKAGAGLAINTGASIVNISNKARAVRVRSLKAKHLAKGNADKVNKLVKKEEKIAQSINRVKNFKQNASKITSNSTKQNAKKAIGKLKEKTFDKTKFGGWIKGKQKERTRKRAAKNARKMQRKIGKKSVFKGLLRFFHSFGIVKKVVGIAVVFFIIIICCASAIGSGAVNWLPDCSIRDEAGHSVAQETVNYIYGYQQAYINNLTNASTDSKFASYGIPDTWTLADEAASDSPFSINNCDAAEKSSGINTQVGLSFSIRSSFIICLVVSTSRYLDWRIYSSGAVMP